MEGKVSIGGEVFAGFATRAKRRFGRGARPDVACHYCEAVQSARSAEVIGIRTTICKRRRQEAGAAKLEEICA